jgi:rhamnose utilization protein RhaD (predicted bifunctional aldolase and dehydrogenase)
MSLLVDESWALDSASKYCKVSYVPYVRPGLGLAAAFKNSVDSKSKAALLGNHGLTVWGDSADECIDILNNLENIWADQFDLVNQKELSLHPDWRQVLTNGILIPDQVVFLGENPFCNLAPRLKAREGLSDLAKFNLGNSAWLDEFVEVLELIAKNVSDPASIKYLSQIDIDELLNWEAEKYRQSRQ